jgi:hypothetical protein
MFGSNQTPIRRFSRIATFSTIFERSSSRTSARIRKRIRIQAGDNPSDLFQHQPFQDDRGSPLFNFGKLSGSDLEITFGTSLPFAPVLAELRLSTNATTANETPPPASTIFIWNGMGAWPTALANWNSGAPANSSIDSVILQTGTTTFNLPNTTIGFLTIDQGATLDIVGGLLSTHGLIDNGANNVDGDPPALIVNGPAVIGNGGTLTAQDDSIIFTNGSLLNAGTLRLVLAARS